MSLTDRQRRFVEEYLVDLNARQAAVRAGYTARGARTTGPRLLKDPEIAAAVAEAQAERGRRTGITADRVLQELALLGFANMLDYMTVQPDGTAYVDLAALDRPQAAAIQEVVVDEYKEGRGAVARDVKRVRVKLADKRGALDLLGKHLGLFKERPEHAQPDGTAIGKTNAGLSDVERAQRLAALLDAARARRTGRDRRSGPDEDGLAPADRS